MLYFLDKIGAYAFLAMINLFPIGSYEILSSYDLKNIRYEENQFVLQNGTPIFGLILARILCPADLDLPFLYYFSEKTKRISLPCCKTCADTKAKNCNHTKRYVDLCFFYFFRRMPHLFCANQRKGFTKVGALKNCFYCCWFCVKILLTEYHHIPFSLSLLLRSIPPLHTWV